MFSRQVTFHCDECDQNYMLDEETIEMDLPPGWIGLQIAFADSEGFLKEHEQDNYSHFCSLECLVKHIQGEEIRERHALSDVDFSGEDDDLEETS